MNSDLVATHLKDLTALRSCVGRRLVSITRTLYLFNGKPNEIGHGDVELCFEADMSVVLSLATNGESVAAEWGPLKVPPAFDLNDDAHCAWEALRVSDTEPFNQFVGATLSSVHAVVDRWKTSGHETLSGWVMHFGDRLFTFMNQGDESRLALDMPSSDSRLITSFEDLGTLGAG